MSEYIELTEPCGLLTIPGVREYVCRLESVGEGTVNVTVCAPTEPIVRCRDCRHSDTLETAPSVVVRCCYMNKLGTPRVVGDDGFCAWACRKEQ